MAFFSTLNKCFRACTRLFTTISEWLIALWRLFFPLRCTICGAPLLSYEKHICLACRADMPFTYHWSYSGSAAEERFATALPIESLSCLFIYSGSYKQIIYAIKYRNATALAQYMGRMLGEKMRPNADFDYIIPVPLHWRRRLKRGYNQSELIARGIMEGAQMKHASLSLHSIKRKRYTGTQTAREREERFRNVQEAFALPRKEQKGLYGAKVLLVDDVLTTGATLRACAYHLQKRYNCKISIATLAYDE